MLLAIYFSFYFSKALLLAIEKAVDFQISNCLNEVLGIRQI